MYDRKTIKDFATFCLNNNMNIRFPAHHSCGLNDYYSEKMPWCCAFVCMCLDFVGAREYIIDSKYPLDCDVLKNILISKNRFDCTKNYGGGGYTPQTGDIVFLSKNNSFNDITHVAIVYEYDKNTGNFRIIEGNYEDKMNTRVLNIKDKYVVGFGNIGW